MVQVITPTRQKQPSFLQSVLGGLSEGVPQAIEKYQGMKQQQSQKQQEFVMKAALEREKQAAKYGEKFNALKNLGLVDNPGNSLRGQYDENPQESQKEDGSFNEEMREPARRDRPPHSPEKIERAALADPTLANTFQRQNEDWNRQKQHEENQSLNRKKQARAEEISFHKEGLNYDEELLKNYKTATKQDIALKDMEKAVDSGKVKPSHIANFFKGVGTLGDKISEALLTGDQATILANIPYLIEGWKDIFGVRLSDADLRVIQDKLPSIGKSKESNKSIINIMRKYSDINKLRYKIGTEIKKENKGLRPLGYSEKVEDRYENMMKDVKVRNPHTGNVVQVPAYQVSRAIESGGELVDE